MGTSQSAIGQLELPEENERLIKRAGGMSQNPATAAVPAPQSPDNMYAPADANQGDLELPAPTLPAMAPGTYQTHKGGALINDNWRNLDYPKAHAMAVGVENSLGMQPESDSLWGAVKPAIKGFGDFVSQSYHELDNPAWSMYPGAQAVAAIPHIMARGVEGLATGLEHSGRQTFEGVKHNDPLAASEGFGEVLGTVGQSVGPEELARETAHGPSIGERVTKASDRMSERRATKGAKRIRTALDTPAGKGGERAASMDRAIEDTKSDLAEIERNEPGKAKGAQAYHELAEKIEARQDKLWEDGHKPGIERHADAPVDHKAIVKAGEGSITPEAADAAPHEADAAREWLKGLDKERGLKSADQLIREINNDLKGKSAATYGPVQIRVRQAVVKALRSEVDRVLEQSGEQGVKDVNRRWGALNEVNEQIRTKAYDQARKEGKEGALPEWAHAYAFLHPTAIASHGIPATVGLGLKLSKLVGPKTGGKALRAGMRDLGRTNLQAPTVAPTPEGWGAPPKGLLPAPTPPVQGLPGPGAAEIAHPEMFPAPSTGAEAPRMVYRDKGTGRMQRGYKGENAPKVTGHTAEGGPIKDNNNSAPKSTTPLEREDGAYWLDKDGNSVGAGEHQDKYGNTGVDNLDEHMESTGQVRIRVDNGLVGVNSVSPLTDSQIKAVSRMLKDNDAIVYDFGKGGEGGLNSGEARTMGDFKRAHDKAFGSPDPGFKTETDSMGIKWAISEDGKYRVSVPKRITPEELSGYVKEKLDEQRTIHGKIKPTSFGETQGAESGPRNDSHMVIEGVDEDAPAQHHSNWTSDRIRYDPFDKEYPRRRERGKTKRT